MTDETDREALTAVLHDNFEAARGRQGVSPSVLADAVIAAGWSRGSARVQPTRDEINHALDIELARDENWHPNAKVGLEVGASERLTDAILALLSSTPTVAQVQAEALREAAQIVDDTARQGGGLQTAAGTLRLEADVLAPETKEDDRG